MYQRCQKGRLGEHAMSLLLCYFRRVVTQALWFQSAYLKGLEYVNVDSGLFPCEDRKLTSMLGSGARFRVTSLKQRVSDWRTPSHSFADAPVHPFLRKQAPLFWIAFMLKQLLATLSWSYKCTSLHMNYFLHLCFDNTQLEYFSCTRCTKWVNAVFVFKPLSYTYFVKGTRALNPLNTDSIWHPIVAQCSLPPLWCCLYRVCQRLL